MTTKAKQTITSLPLTALLIITDSSFILQEPVTHPKKSKLYFSQQATQKTSQNYHTMPDRQFWNKLNKMPGESSANLFPFPVVLAKYCNDSHWQFCISNLFLGHGISCISLLCQTENALNESKQWHPSNDIQAMTEHDFFPSKSFLSCQT